jgi:hypothetical protein
MSPITCMLKYKKEMEQLCKSFLGDLSSREGLLAHWFELDTYAILLEKSAVTLSEDTVFVLLGGPLKPKEIAWFAGEA